MRGLTLALGAAVLVGCTHWSEYGQGGAAEQLPESAMTVEDESDTRAHHELQQDLNHSRQHLEVLVIRGAQRCFPASVYTAGLQRDRVARELAGGLIEDAETSLLDLRIELHRLEQKIEAMNHADYCWDNNQQAEMAMQDDLPIPTDSSSNGEVDFEGLSLLLNSDNQFAFGSHGINPKYRQNLATACTILLQADNVVIDVTGHADASGAGHYNRHLSSKRAMAVVDFLTTCGVEASRIRLSFAGNSQPLFIGRSPEIDLVNRRVAIRLEPNQQSISP